MSDIFRNVMDPAAPAYVVAEIGINHNGSLDIARRTIDAAADAGADAVKFQNFRTDDFVTDRGLTYSYVSGGRTVTEPLHDMFARVEIGRDFLATVAEHCAARGIDWHSTPTNAAGIGDLLSLNVTVLKNGSDYLGHLPLIAEMAATGLPLVLSTGMATLSDIEDAVTVATEAGGERLILLHCTSQYPTPAAEVALRRMVRLRAAFGLPVGFSDHTEGSVAATAAVALGARWIEKHFTLDRSLAGPDHAMSEDPQSFRAYVRDIRAVEAMLSNDTLRLSAREMEARGAHRLSCVAARDLEAGHTIGAGDLRFARPGTGFPPKHASLVAGKTLRRAVRSGMPFSADDFV